MKVNKAELDVVAVRRSQYPDKELPEFLLLGRSNVGKSSFINTLANQKKLARISNKPGKTQTLNFYLMNNSFYVVDVPGYGYASVNKKEQQKFGLMIEEYLEKRDVLKRVFLIVDFRIKPTEDDLLMYKFLKYYNLPTTIIATKLDKVSPSKRQRHEKIIKDTLALEVGDDLVLFSNLTKEGKDKILNIMEKLIISEEAI